MKAILTGIASVLIVIGAIIGVFAVVSLIAYGVGRLMEYVPFFENLMFDDMGFPEYVLIGCMGLAILLLVFTIGAGITAGSISVYESLTK